MNENTFKALVVSQVDGGKFIREIKTRNIADLPEGEVLVNVKYSSLNYKDALSATGNKGVTRNFPHTPGVDAAGVIMESAVDQFKAGDEVIVTGYDLGMNTAGGFGQYIRVPATWVAKRPDNLSLHESMVYGTAGLTAALSIDKLLLNNVRPEQGEILVTGATGGVGSLSVSILAKLGFDVVASTGKLKEKGFLISLGAKEVIDREELNDQSGRPIGKPRWAGVIDSVAGDTLTTALKTTKPGGSVTCCGMIRSMEFSSSIFPFILRGVNLLGIDSVDIPIETKTRMWHKLADDWKVDHLGMLCEDTTLEALDNQIDTILAGQIKGRTVVDL